MCSNLIGKAHLLDLEMLVPNRPVRLLAMGDLGTNSAPTSDNPKVEPLSAIHCLVVGAGGDMHQLMESIRKIKENVPRLKVNPSLTIAIWYNVFFLR